MAGIRQKAAREDQRDVIVRMPASLHEALKAKAASEDLTMAQALRKLIRGYVK